MRQCMYEVFFTYGTDYENFAVSVVQHKGYKNTIVLTFTRDWEQEREQIDIPSNRYATFKETIQMGLAEACIEPINGRTDQQIIYDVIKREYGDNANIQLSNIKKVVIRD